MEETKGAGRGSRLRSRRLALGTEAPVAGAGEAEDVGQESVSPVPTRKSPIIEKLEELVLGTASSDSAGGYRGTSGARRGFRADKYEMKNTRGVDKDEDGKTFPKDKKGNSGQVIPLLTNYFSLQKECSWSLYKYAVDFSTQIDSVGFRKKLVHSVEKKIGAYIFDGSSLYKTHELESPLELEAYDERKKENVMVTIKFASKLLPGDHMYMQFYNILLRKCLFGMGLDQLGRNYFDATKSHKKPEFGLELWPGYVTSIRNHEKEVLLCVEITHKVLRIESVLETIRKLQNAPDYHKAVSDALIGSIVLTNYNNTTYRVDDVDWNSSPRSSFDKKGHPTTFAEYYTAKYGHSIKITDMGQPLLLARATKKDLHRGEPKPVLLIPETCQMTGLTDAMRANFSLMKALAGQLQMVPTGRVDALNYFMGNLLSKNKEALSDWGIQFNNDLVKCGGRVLPKEGIVFGPGGDNKPEMPNDQADWTMAFRKRKMLKCEQLEKWAVLVPQRDAPNMDNLIKVMSQVAKPLGMNIHPPVEIVKLPDTKNATYLRSLDALNNRGNLQMIFVVLPNNKLELYGAVKKRLAADFGIPSQCFLAKNLTNKGLMSIATKVVVQMNAKLGGEPWSVVVPMKSMMVVGFDAYRGGATKSGAIGATVATINSTFSRYFSTISNHNGHEDIGNNIAADLAKCLDAYKLENKGALPQRVILYRDGVGEGQLNYVVDNEVELIRKALESYYVTCSSEIVPKFTFIVVTKKINTRMFTANKPGNPPPGTIVDDIITLPERYDFYLITAAARQGTVSPCMYNVLHDTQEVGADKIQRITYKMCHLYYNWSGTVAVPAPCQYAHKLAFLTGMAIGGKPHQKLATKLHFL